MNVSKCHKPFPIMEDTGHYTSLLIHVCDTQMGLEIVTQGQTPCLPFSSSGRIPGSEQMRRTQGNIGKGGRRKVWSLQMLHKSREDKVPSIHEVSGALLSVLHCGQAVAGHLGGGSGETLGVATRRNPCHTGLSTEGTHVFTHGTVQGGTVGPGARCRLALPSSPGSFLARLPLARLSIYLSPRPCLDGAPTPEPSS